MKSLLKFFLFALLSQLIFAQTSQPITAGQINGTYYLAACNSTSPSSWCQGSDVGAWINAAAANCQAMYNNMPACNIILPEANNMVWSTPAVISGAGISLYGYGPHDSVFHCTMPGVCLTITDTAHFTTEKGSRFQGFRLNGNPRAEAGLEIVDYQTAHVEDVAFYNFTGGTGLFLLANTRWVEGGVYVGVDGSNNLKDFRLASAKKNASFGYNRFLDLRCYIIHEQTCFSVENNSSLYNSSLVLSANKGGDSAGVTVFNVQDTAHVEKNEIILNGEDTGRGGYLFNTTPSTTFSNDYHVFWAGAHTPSNIQGSFAMATSGWAWQPPNVGGEQAIWTNTRNEGPTLFCPIPGGIQCSIDFQGYVQAGSDGSNGFYVNTRNGSEGGVQRLHIDNAGDVTFPNSTKITGANIPIAASFATTASPSDRVPIQGATPGSHCWLTPTNAGAASGISSVWLSAPSANQVTVNHTPTAGWTFNLFCTPN